MCDPHQAEGMVPLPKVKSEPVCQFLRLIAHEVVRRLKTQQSASENPKTPSASCDHFGAIAAGPTPK
jgi:hypothetical protein